MLKRVSLVVQDETDHMGAELEEMGEGDQRHSKESNG
jgi:hypothetical protein